VERLHEHPRSRWGDLRIVRCGRFPPVRGDPGVHGRLIREVQLGDPVEGLLAAVEDIDEPAGLGAPQAGNLVDQRQVDVEVMAVEGVVVFKAGCRGPPV
jgi:hypothetical protein